MPQMSTRPSDTLVIFIEAPLTLPCLMLTFNSVKLFCVIVKQFLLVYIGGLLYRPQQGFYLLPLLVLSG